MIPIVVDTNILLRGMFGYKSFHRWILALASMRRIQIYGSQETFKEFCEKIREPNFKKYWEKKNFSDDKIILDYKSLVTMHEPTQKYKDMIVPISDPDDSIFFKIALSKGIKIIVSEDKHLVKLHKFENIRVVSAEKFIKSYRSQNPNFGI